MLGQGNILPQDTTPHFSGLMTKMKMNEIFFATFTAYACFRFHASVPSLIHAVTVTNLVEGWEAGLFGSPKPGVEPELREPETYGRESSIW